MNKIKDLHDLKVKRLAQTLKDSGLAASESEAIRMAFSMTGTQSKISEKRPADPTGFTPKTHEQIKEEIKGDFDSSKTKEDPKQEQEPAKEEPKQELEKPKVQEPVEDLDEDIPRTQETYKQDVIDKEKDIYNMTVEEASKDFDEEEVTIEEEKVKEDIQEETEAKNEPQPVVQKEASQQEYTQTETKKEEPPKKDVSQFEESKVDLSKVFSFGK